MTPGNTGPSDHYARYMPQAYKDAVQAAFSAGVQAERMHAFGNYDGEQAAARAVEEHLDQTLPIVKEYGEAIDSALRLLDAESPKDIPALETATKALEKVSEPSGLLYLPADWA